MIANPFAGILGLLCFSILVLRGLIGGDSLDTTMQTAIVGMIFLSVLGYVIGEIAERTVEESVRAQLKAASKDESSEATES